MNQKEILDNIMSRTSVRSFLNQPVESEKVEMLLHAAMQHHRLVTNSPGTLL